MNVAFKQGDFVNFKPLLDFKKMAKTGAIGKKTIVFNNLVTNLQNIKKTGKFLQMNLGTLGFLTKSFHNNI